MQHAVNSIEVSAPVAPK